MKDLLTKRSLYILYKMLEIAGSLFFLWLLYIWFGWLGVLIGAVGLAKSIKEVDKLLGLK